MSIKRILASFGIILLLSTAAVAAPSVSVTNYGVTFTEAVTPEMIEEAKKQQEARKLTISKTQFRFSKISSTDIAAFVKAFPDAEKVDLGYSDKITDISPIAQLKNLKNFNVNARNLKDVTALAGLTNLERIYLTYEATGQDLKWMTKLSKLKAISITPRGLTSLEGLPSLPSMTRVIIDYIDVDSLDILVTAMPRLENLSLRYSSIKDMAAITKLINLKDLNLYGAKIKDFATLAKLPKLERVMYYAVKGADFSTLGALKQVKHLHGGLSSMNSIAWMKDMPNLQKFNVFAEDLDDYTPLKNAPNLKDFHIWKMNTPVGDLAFLKSLKNMEVLRIDNNKGVKNFEVIGELPNLKQLNITRNNEKKNTIINYGFLQKLPKLNRLILSANTAENLDVQNLKELAVLDFEYMNLGDDRKPLDLSLVKNLPNLKTLEIENCRVSNLQNMENLPQLQSISMVKTTGVTDFSSLSKFSKLKSISVSKAGFTDAQLATVPEGIKVNKR